MGGKDNFAVLVNQVALLVLLEVLHQIIDEETRELQRKASASNVEVAEHGGRSLERGSGREKERGKERTVKTTAR